MRRTIAGPALFGALVFLSFGAAFAAPKLFVIVSVDQMRAAYLDVSTPTYTAGLARLKREGFVFKAARYDHVPTDTAPGHAVISTGRLPGSTGIVGNHWFDRAAGATTNCIADSVHGFGPEHLWGYTVGDALKASRPRSRVVSVSLKDRAAILLGGKRADAAFWYSAALGGFRTSTYYARPGWLDAFNRRLRERGGPLHDATTSYYSAVALTPEADQMVLELALEAAKRYQLGLGPEPDLLAVGFSATDFIGHRYGPGSPEMTEQLARLDRAVGELIEGLERQAGHGRVGLVLTADHGAHADPPHAKRITLEQLTESIERALQHDFPAADKWLLANHYPNLYLNRAQARRIGLNWRALLRQAAARLASVDGIARAFISDELDPQDPYYALYARSIAPGRSGDIIALPARDVIVCSPPGVDGHGTPYDYDSRVPLIFWGADVRVGRSTETVRVADLAPTAAALLGFDFRPERDSRALPVAKPK